MNEQINIVEGTPCRTCGSVRRYVSSGKCVACKSRMNREWYAKHPEYRPAYDKDKAVARNKEYRQRKPEISRAANRAWNERNRERVRATTAAWAARNKQRRVFSQLNRVASIKAAYQDGTATFDYRQALLLQPCFYCGQSPDYAEITVDHLIPVRAYGAPHCSWNMVACCKPCNRKKGDTLDIRIVRAVAALPQAKVWVDGPGRDWMSYVVPLITDGPRIARDLFKGTASAWAAKAA